jgi:succinyl-diaminopimelate desuccinylase
VITLDLRQDGPSLAAELVDIPSVSGTEAPLATAIHDALSALAHLRVDRDGDAVVARTDLGRARRICLAGHIDTVPEADNLPGRRVDGQLYGLGACDMKGGVAVILRLAATLGVVATDPTWDVTYVLYDGEEVAEPRNGLRRLAEQHRDWLDCDLAVLMEPSDAGIEAGCQGTLRAEVRTTGRRAHSARSWTGENAIHAAAPVLQRLVDYQAGARRPVVDGLEYHEGLNAVRIAGGIAGNVVPDACVVTVNYRFAPDRSLDEALAYVREVFDGFDVQLSDGAPGARPGLQVPTVAKLVDAVGGHPRPKFGWTDVARFAALGIPAVNYGPGDPELAHTRDEHVPEAQIAECEERLGAFLTA